MSTTLSMWLGIAFLALAIIAVLLQAWLWGPKFWDDEAKKTRAPKFWLRMHALAGYTYGVIYVLMMWFMLPRLWEYQYELPARTVIHAVLGIVIGVLLITKIVILLFFRHFEESMPSFGFGLLISTVAMTMLSVPYALRAHDLSGRTTDPDNVERVRKLLAEVEMEQEIAVEDLITEKAFDRGRQVLVKKCITCHDMRTVLVKPRTAKGWYKVNQRMLEKPAVFGEQLDPADIPYVTAYLVAITPDIQKSAREKREQSRAVMARTNAMVDAVHNADAAEIKVDEAAGEKLLQAKCIDCHEMDEVEEHGGDDLIGWRGVVAAMVEEGMEVTDEEADLLARYLTVKWPATNKPMPAIPDTPDDDRADDEAADDAEGEAKPAPEAAAGAAAGDPAAGGETGDQPKPKPKKKAKAKPKFDKKAGRTIFMKKCKACHGSNGKGDTPFGRKVQVRSLSRSGRSHKKIRALTANGVPGTKMKPYRGKLNDKELDDVAAFVRAL
ncbi:MAG: c-type cytochrome [Myxococcota bacterium]